MIRFVCSENAYLDGKPVTKSRTVNMEQQILKEEYRRQLKEDDGLKFKLAVANRKKIRTIEGWRRTNDQILTTATNLAIIRKHLRLSSKVNLTEVIKVNTL